MLHSLKRPYGDLEGEGMFKYDWRALMRALGVESTDTRLS